MSDPLALARLAPLSRLVPARGEARLVADGPVVNADGTRGVVYAVFGGGVNVAIDDGSGGRLGTWLWEDVRVDTGEGAMRDRLVRLGLIPYTLRDHPGAAVAAGMGVCPRVPVLPAWAPIDHPAHPWERKPDERPCLAYAEVFRGGWRLILDGRVAARGDEEGPAGKLAADLAALRLGCVLEEPDGYLIPLPGGGVGFVKKESP